MSYGVETLEVYPPKPSCDIAIVMIPPYPNDPLAVRDLFNKVQDLLMRWLQSLIRVVDYVTIQDKFMLFRNTSEKELKVLI
jgi:hypothetical protein